MSEDNFEINNEGHIYRRRGFDGMLRTEKVAQRAKINWILNRLGIERPDKYDVARLAKILMLALKYDDFIRRSTKKWPKLP